jgi:O-succinylhomoserine sulfhydrylase
MGGSGNLIAFTVAGGKAGAFRFLDALELVDLSNNLGDAKSLITHPGTTTHSRLTAAERADLGIDEGLVRISVGLEDVADIIEDLDAALKAA